MENRKKVGLALGGGVVRGLAHLGVMEVLTQAGIQIDYLAGSSAGSLVGYGLAAGRNLSEIQAFAKTLTWWRILGLTFPFRGFVTFAPLQKRLVKTYGNLAFEELPVPFAAIATDLRSGDAVVISTGKVAPAVHASCAVPGLIKPVKLAGRLLIDGSLSNTVPVDVVRQMGADYVIGVDIFSPALHTLWGPFGTGFTALEHLIQRAGSGYKTADCLIRPKLAGKTYMRFSEMDNLYQIGKMAAEEKIDSILAALDVPA